MFATTFHIAWPWWTWALVAWLIVLVLGVSDVKSVSGVLGVFVVAEMVINLALSIDGLRHPAPHADYLAALSPHGLNWSTFSVAGAVAVLCFVGFEIAPVYRAE